MDGERKMVLNLLSEGKITVDEAEELLGALSELEDGCHSPGKTTKEEQTDFVDRLSKMANEMSEAGQELPGRLARMLDSMFGGAGRSGRNAERVFGGSLPTGTELRKVDLATINGSLKVITWERPEYRVIARAQVRGVESQNEAEQRLASDLRLSVDRGILSLECLDRSLLNSLSVEATVPQRATYDVTASSKNGSITISGVEGGTLDARSSNGRIILEEVKATTVRASTRNGAVQASGSLGDGLLETSNGSITAALEYEDSGNLELSTGNGSVKVKLPEVPQVTYELNAETVNGSLKISAEGATVRTEKGVQDIGPKRATVTVPGSSGNQEKVDVKAHALNGFIAIITE